MLDCTLGSEEREHKLLSSNDELNVEWQYAAALPAVAMKAQVSLGRDIKVSLAGTLTTLPPACAVTENNEVNPIMISCRCSLRSSIVLEIVVQGNTMPTVFISARTVHERVVD